MFSTPQHDRINKLFATQADAAAASSIVSCLSWCFTMSELCPRLMRATSATFARITDVVTSPPRLALGSARHIGRAALVQAAFQSQQPNSPAMSNLCPLRHRRLASFPSAHSVNSSHGSSVGCLDAPFPTTPILRLQVRSYSRQDARDASPSPVTQKGKYSRGLGVQREPRQDIFGEPKPRMDRGGETLTKYYATCAPGLEEVLAAELASPLVGAQEVEVGSAGVSFVGSKATGYQATLWLRTAVRVLVQLAAGPLPLGRGQFDPVYIFIRDSVDWPSILVDDSSPPTQQQQVSYPRQSGFPSCP